MFEPIDHPRVFACPPGADFPKHFVQGFLEQAEALTPEQRARVTVMANASRMRDRIAEEFILAGAGLMPRLSLITDLGDFGMFHLAEPAISPLRRRLQLRQLVARLAETVPGLVPSGAEADLAESLETLLAEMEDEGVAPEALRDLDVSGHAEHWSRILSFVNIVTRFAGGDRSEPMGPAARFRYVAELVIASWQTTPPPNPVIIAGSTGSRGTTSLLMRAVAKLPQGALVLPGLDFECPPDLFRSALVQPSPAQDHPQFRYADLFSRLNISRRDVRLWGPDLPEAQKCRNRLVSLALRPAPVTHQWQAEAPALVPEIGTATDNVILIEAESPAIEAISIAVCIRQGIEDRQSVALITPDSDLIRRVTAQLGRWQITPDSSMGQPLLMSPSGRLFRQVLALARTGASPASLLALLKHPLVATGGNGRGAHLKQVRRFELFLREKQKVRAGAAERADFGKARKAEDWVAWLDSAIFEQWPVKFGPLSDHLQAHIDIVEGLARGPHGDDAREVWAKQSGQALRKFLAELSGHAGYGGTLSLADYAELFETLLKGIEARDPVTSDPRVMIWGTQEARVQGADRVILGGLNDGIWPAHLAADPWMNRPMRDSAGLLSPERKIGLSAHDFQQAIGARDVVLTRAIRDDEAETVPSRWLNRLTNLLQGMQPDLPAKDTALEAMRIRGNRFVSLARMLDMPPTTGSVSAAPRPAPAPPAYAQPRRLSVTEITRLIRDPYAIYAKHVLRLRKLDPLGARPDARLRGIVLHDVLADFFNHFGMGPNAEAQLRDMARKAFAEHVPWPETRIVWSRKFENIIPQFIAAERIRQIEADILAHETKAEATFPELDFTLAGVADRIDGLPDGTARIWDYKTGNPPMPIDQKRAERQLYLEAILLANGAFKGLPPMETTVAGYIKIGSSYAERREEKEFAKFDATEERDKLLSLLRRYLSGKQGYASRRLPMKSQNYEGDFDHLARYGEWQDVDDAIRVELT